MDKGSISTILGATFAFGVTRHFPWRDVLAYVGGQFLGAVAGTLTLKLLFGSFANLGATLPADSAWQSLGLEVLLTAVLMFVIFAVTQTTRLTA